MNNSMQQNSSEANLSIYYLLFGIESFIIALLIAYLIMSGFNKNNFRKTLINKDKTTIYILLSLVLTFSLTFLISFFTNKYINSGNNKMNVNNNQKAEGNIVVDNISILKMDLKNNSSYKGSINNDKSVKNITLKLDKTSKITLTGDSYVTSLEDDDTSYSNINFNGYKLFVSKKAIN